MSAPASMAGRSTAYAPNGMVATSQPMASSVALGVLRDGGNAFDAAIAASAVLSLVEPHMTGLGGDLWALFWSADEGRLVGLDATGRAGTNMTPERIRADGYDRVPGSGPGAVTVPGAIAGWGALNETYGTRPLAELVAPAIAIAEEGFPVTPIIARQWEGQLRKLQADTGAAATYLIDGERAPEAGEWFRNPDFARSLRTIAEEGPSAMYGGALGTRVAEGLAELGGYLTPADMAAMEVRWIEPLSMDYRGWTIWELPPAGQGVAALQMFGMLEGFDLASMGHNSPEYLHHLIEAKKVAFADLARHVGDADHMEIDPSELLDRDYLAQRRGLINPAVAAERVEPGEFATATETIYLSVADRYGNMVSFIHSIYGAFGSGVVVPGTGFVLQNRGAGFTLEDGHPNQVAPGKRPFHTLIPGFVTKDGEPLMAFGVMGGSMQPQGHTQVILNMIEFRMDPQQAIDAARFRHMGGLRVAMEQLTDGLEAGMSAFGHELVDWESASFGGGQLVMKLERGWAGASDPRKDGLAIGH
ncbi:gamma-glutamyltransferase [Candidatus Palauibacter sp.]|uniref:gamma-glutamyltransferase n=1 Tax=Candidatus Palauibacter sp. TaxID=3101350 RepID=UPI003B01E21B